MCGALADDELDLGEEQPAAQKSAATEPDAQEADNDLDFFTAADDEKLLVRMPKDLEELIR